MFLKHNNLDHPLKTFASLNEDEITESSLNINGTGFLEKKGILFGYSNSFEGKNYESFYRMRELDEVLGPLHHVENSPHDGCLALIGKIPVLLPSEIFGELQKLIGRKIGILRLDGYHIREVA